MNRFAQDTPADPAQRATGMTLRVGRIVDLSHPINADTQVYPGDPVPQLNPATTIDRDGYNVLQVSMGSQTGTHVDAPYHFLADGARIDAMDLTMFLGPATVVDLRGLTPRSTISWPQLEPSVSADGRGVDPGAAYRLVPALALPGVSRPSLPRAGCRRRHRGGRCPYGGHRRDECRRDGPAGRRAG